MRKMLTGLCLVFVVLVMAGVSFSAIPKKISFQRRLLTSAGTPVSDGNYSITFRIYDASSGGAALWSETQTVATTSGYYNVVLGSTTAITLAFDKDYWISVQVGTDAEMIPRFYLGASGYCINADTVDGVDSSSFVQLTSGNLYVGSPTVTTAKVSVLETGTANHAGYFVLDNASNPNSAVYGQATGTGNAGKFEIINSSNSNSTVYASHNGTGSLFFGNTNGTGNLLQLQKSSSNKFIVDNSGNVAAGNINASTTSENTIGTAGKTTFYGDGSSLSNLPQNGPGNAPIGSVMAWLKSFPNTPTLPSGWVECNGQVISDSESQYNGQTIPDLNGSGGGTKKFLRGSTTSGSTGGTDTINLEHTHQMITNKQGNGYGGYEYAFASDNPYTNSALSSAQSILPSYYEIVWIMRVK